MQTAPTPPLTQQQLKVNVGLEEGQVGSCPDTDIDLRFFSSMPSGVSSSLEVKEKGMSDGLLHSFYAVFRFLRGVNRL